MDEEREEGQVGPVGRAAAVAAVVLAVAAAAWVFFGGATDPYEVTARFQNAGLLVEGNPVQASGARFGTVSKIRISADGHADVTLKIDDSRSPLRRGTRATIRQTSLSGIANKYVDLSLPEGRSGELPDGGRIGVDATRSAVDLDQLFNTLDPETRRSLQGFFKGQARQFEGRGEQANKGLEYLNPALSTSSRLFSELTRDTPVLERFLVDSSRLVTTLAERRDSLAALIGNLNETTGALGRQKTALASSIEQLPPFMRRANTTFVNLRSALDDVDPLVDASKPVARVLDPFLVEARGFAAGAKPTIRDLSITIRRPGRGNDLINLMASTPPLAREAMDTRTRSIAPGGRRVNVGRVPGAFPESAEAFLAAAPELSIARPYTEDFLGWFDDFSNTGYGYDALGAMARAQINFAENLPFAVESSREGGTREIPTAPEPLRKFQYKRCPGSAEAPADDGSNVLSQAEMDRLQCEESARATGDVR